MKEWGSAHPGPVLRVLLCAFLLPLSFHQQGRVLALCCKGVVREHLVIKAYPTWDHFSSYVRTLRSGFWLPKLARIYIVPL